MHKCQSVCVADMVSMLVTFTKCQQTCMLLRSQDFRVWTGSDEARRAGRSLANVADSLLPNFQLVVWPPSQPDLGGSSRERKTIRANWDSFPTHFKALSQCQTHRFTRNVRGNGNGNERYIFQQATLATNQAVESISIQVFNLQTNSCSRYFGTPPPHQLGKLSLQLARVVRCQIFYTKTSIKTNF